MKKTTILTIALLCLNVLCKAQSYNHSEMAPSGQTLYYNVLSSGTAKVVHPASSSEFTWSDYTAPTDTLIIPDSITYNGMKYPVTEIGERAFYLFCQGLTSVVLPNTIQTIGDRAFSYCTGLESVSLGNGVSTIQTMAFAACSTLTSIVLPNSVSFLGTDVFQGCTNMTSATLSNSLSTISNHTFLNCNLLKTVVIPEGITSIGNSAFSSCNHLDSLIIPSSITSIGVGCFSNCDSLELFMLPTTPPTVSNSSFNRTTLVHIPCGTLSAYQSSWGTYRFLFDDPLTDINIHITTNNPLYGNASMIGNMGCDSIIVEAINNTGYHFYAWSNGSISNPDTIQLVGDTTIMALFDINQYSVSGFANYNSCGYVIGSDTVNYLDTVILTASASEGFHFIEWSDGVTDNPRQIVVTQDSILTAIFGCQIIVASNNDSRGRVIGGGIFPYLSNQTISVQEYEGFRFLRWEDGNNENPRIISLSQDTSITAIFVQIIDTPQLCMVSVENNHNMLKWNTDEAILYYRLYRESNVSGIYEVFAEISADSMPMYIDSLSHPSIRSYRYKISGVGEYAEESSLSVEHKTMHLTINQGLGGRWNLQWTPYEGADYTTYIIYRGTNASNLQQIDIMPADGNTSYTDETATSGDVYYQVGIVMSTPCSSPEETAAMKSSSVSLSNIATNSSVGINDIPNSSTVIYSSHGKIQIDGSIDGSISVYDMYGRMISESLTSTIDIPSSGVYLVKVGNNPARKIVVIK